MKNKYVKLLTATALTSVLASGAALAQVKISGYHESNMITGSSTGANSTKQMGNETSLRFTVNGNLNNGMTYLADYEMRNAVTQERLLNIGVTKDLDVYLGAESVKGAEIARTEWYREGRVPLHTLRADIDYSTSEAHTTYGVIGVKVWIYRGDYAQNKK